MNRNIRTKRGFIQLIILIIIALAVVKFAYGVTLKDILNSQAFQDIWTIIKSIFALIWQAITLFIEFLKQIILTSKEFMNGLNK